MNRHARRAAGKNGLVASLDDLSDIATKLQPYITQIEDLKIQLAIAAKLLAETRLENAALATTLNTQKALYFRLFAQGMGVPLDTIVSMAGEIQAQLTDEGETHGIATSRTSSSEDIADDSSA